MAEDPEKIAERLRELERHRERTDMRLDGGAKAFDDVRKEIATLMPKPLPIWQILGVVLATLTTIFGVWWQARGEIDSKASVADVAAVQHEVQEQRVVLTSVRSTAENTAKQVDEMKADTKADLMELKTDIRSLATGRGR